MRGRVAGGLVAVALVAVTASTTSTAATQAALGQSPFGSNWPTYHHDNLRTGVDPTATNLSPPTKLWTSATLDGQLYGEPLVEKGRVFVATEHNTVYALAANSGKTLWSKHLAAPASSTSLPCGNISPWLGVTSTPVIDETRGEIFVLAEQVSNTAVSHHLYGLDLLTGTILLNTAIDPPSSTPADQQQRAGLALDGTNVIVAMGGLFGDCGSYHGWVISVPELGGPHQIFEVDASPGQSKGSIWMGGGAPTIDSQGNIWVATGNGSVTSGTTYDDSDGVLELSSSLALLQFFAPRSWQSDNSADLDLGSTSPELLPTGQVFQVGKSLTAYLLNQSSLGGIGGQVASMPLCGSDPDGGDATSSNVVFVPCGSGLTAVQVKTSPAGMKMLWSNSAAHGPPVISGTTVWSQSTSGQVVAFKATTGAQIRSVPVQAAANHFPTPTIADGLLIVAGTGRVIAFDGPAGPPPPPG